MCFLLYAGMCLYIYINISNVLELTGNAKGLPWFNSYLEEMCFLLYAGMCLCGVGVCVCANTSVSCRNVQETFVLIQQALVDDSWPLSYRLCLPSLLASILSAAACGCVCACVRVCVFVCECACVHSSECPRGF